MLALAFLLIGALGWTLLWASVLMAREDRGGLRASWRREQRQQARLNELRNCNRRLVSELRDAKPKEVAP